MGCSDSELCVCLPCRSGVWTEQSLGEGEGEGERGVSEPGLNTCQMNSVDVCQSANSLGVGCSVTPPHTASLEV